MGNLPLCECPNCRTRADLSVFLTAGEAAEAVNALVETSPQLATFIKPMMLYVRLFVPAGTEIGFKHMARLFRELAAHMQRGTVEKNGVVYKVTPSVWAEAFQAVRESKNLDLPLTNHGYWLGIVVNLAREFDKKSHKTSDARSPYPRAAAPMQRAAPPPPITDEQRAKAREQKAKMDAMLGKTGIRNVS